MTAGLSLRDLFEFAVTVTLVIGTVSAIYVVWVA